MSGSEFISQLSDTLKGEVSEKVLKENITYYDGYIREQIATGKSEEEVMELLGDPRLIARTIIETGGGEGSYSGGEYESYDQTEADSSHPGTGGQTFFGWNLSSGRLLPKVVILLIGLILLLIVVGIIYGLVKILFWPFIVLIVIYMIYKAVKK